MASPVILEDVEKVRQLAKVIWYKEVDAIKSINFPSEQERSKYLRDCRDNHNTVEGLLDQGVELQKKYQKTMLFVIPSPRTSSCTSCIAPTVHSKLFATAR
ncbi:hypothetical protein CsSME_00014709 [Camellia sinensis var. sinensis]